MANPVIHDIEAHMHANMHTLTLTVLLSGLEPPCFRCDLLLLAGIGPVLIIREMRDM